MATAKTNQNSTNLFLRDLLECPVCMETIKSVPVYQCTNGHVICKDCIKELDNCPICRNDSAPARNLQLEKIVQRLEGIQCEKREPTSATPNLQKWGKGSVRSYGTINGTNQETRIDIHLQTNPEQATPRQATPCQSICFTFFLIVFLFFGIVATIINMIRWVTGSPQWPFG